MKRPALTLIFSVLVLLLAACGANPPVPSPAPTEVVELPTPTVAPSYDLNNLYEITWALVSYGDPANPTVLPPGLSITAQFEPDGNLSGSAGCNQYTASYTAASNGAMEITPQMAVSMMMCAEDQMQAESAYLAALQVVQNFSFTPDGNLSLAYRLDDSTEGVLNFKKGAVPLTGTQWVLVAYGDPQNPTLADQATPVTAMFIPGETPEQGIVAGSASCNNYNASYTLDGDQIEFSPAAVTMMFCEAGAEQEATFLAALSTAQSFEITGQRLAISYDEGKGLLTFSAASLPFTKTLWTLASIDGVPLPEEVAITALFTPGADPGQGAVSGIAACNNYNAGYTQNLESDPAGLSISPAVTTMMLCDESLMQAEQSYLMLLHDAQSYQILGATLQINTTMGNALTFVASRTPLVGALWQLVSLGDIENPVAPVEGANFTAQFTRNPASQVGVLSGATGCNQYATSFTASLTEMKINPPGSTQNRTCAPGLTDQENLYYLALNDVSTYSIQGNTLIMPYDSGKQELVYQAVQLAAGPLQPLSNLDGTQWYLWSLNNEMPVAGSTISAAFTINPDGAGGKINGNAGCNTYIAEFGLDLGVKTTLTSNQQCTNPPGVMDFEQKYISALSQAYGFWLTGDQLILNSAAGALTYRLTPPISASDQTHLLVNQNWFLVSFNTNYSLAGVQEPFTRFNLDGTLNGFTGCNNFNARYTTIPAAPLNQIQISQLSSTKAACTSPELATQEQSMLAVLTNAQNYRVTGSSMQITSPQGNLTYSLRPLNRPEEVAPPNAVIIAPSMAPVNQTVTLNGATSTSGVPIVRWRWDFGDGGRGTGAVVQHVYTRPGSYRVQMTIDDQLGRVSSTAATIEVIAQILPTPTAIPTAQPTPEPTVPPAPEPTATPTGEPPAQPTEAPTEVPTEAPPPTPEPTPEPQLPPTAVLQAPSAGFVGEPLSFSAAGSTAGSSPIQSYSWNFGDGQTAETGGSAEATHLFNQGGAFQVTVIVTDANGLTSSASAEVRVDTRLDTTVWSLLPTSTTPPAPNSVITLQFLNGQVTGFGGCNSYSGAYTATDNGDGTYTVVTSNLTTSQMMCPQAIMQAESNFFAALGQVATARVNGNALILSYPAGVLNFEELYTPR
jgi:heat shock protein HslJ